VRSPDVRRLLPWFAGFCAFEFALLALVRSYSGGDWGGDWYEHYERALFFLNGGPRDVKFLGTWLLPARPPFMNLVGAFFLSLAGRSYASYQVVATLLNATAFLGAALFLRLFSRRGRALPVLAALFLLSPLVAENTTYCWTRLYAAFYALTGVFFYAAGFRFRDRGKLALGAVCLAAGVLVHYSIAPFLIAVVCHAAFTFFRSPRLRSSLAVSGAVAGALFFTWLGWSLSVYGTRVTFASNSTAEGAREFTPAGWAVHVAKNLYFSAVPHPLRNPDRSLIAQTSRWGYLRDYWFLIYQTNLFLGLGLSGALLFLAPRVKCETTAKRRKGRARRRPDRSLRRFFVYFVLFVAFLGIAADSDIGPFGSAHACLQPLVLMGLALAAAKWERVSPLIRRLAFVLLVTDAVLGIALPFAIEHQPLEGVSRMAVHWPDRMPAGLSWTAYANALAKERFGVTFLGDLAAPAAPAIAVLSGLAGAAVLIGLWRKTRAGLAAAPPEAVGSVSCRFR
jgi:hypothetical protein